VIQERIPKRVYEFTVYGKGTNELMLARSVLLASGVPAEQMTEEGCKNGHLLKCFFEEPAPSQRLHKLFQKLNLPGTKVFKCSLRPNQWLTLWKKHWRPARLTKKLDVVPVWYKDKYRIKKGRDYILMDTLLSFGTGLHETTQIMSQLIEDCRHEFTSFMDIGTGTGILTMVALKHGVKKTFSVDIGDLSVQAARDNMKANRLKAVIKKADIKDFKHKYTYDFVAANLVTHDLIAYGRQIARFVKPGGYLAVSGISLDNLDKLCGAFEHLPLTCLKTVKGKQWAGLLYVKKTS
jgi:ribosomal protein L11 methyltransferase